MEWRWWIREISYHFLFAISSNAYFHYIKHAFFHYQDHWVTGKGGYFPPFPIHQDSTSYTPNIMRGAFGSRERKVEKIMNDALFLMG